MVKAGQVNVDVVAGIDSKTSLQHLGNQAAESTIRDDENIEQCINNEGSTQKQIKRVSKRCQQRYNMVFFFQDRWAYEAKLIKSIHNGKMRAANNENQMNKLLLIIAEVEKSFKKKLWEEELKTANQKQLLF
ncbi:unnamed protein product [Lepeophtheirus salmonis]|uniref:(salmon louse) hypothetical protein n=1 Tax=Lepeophtheirus salmonis TaxID=72036 RepID=A0A7R8CXD4_LEPSM|nr:unnamed protein product [Lepeophtheirus salmonis]CAF2959677.1 unnamed protein product [Lepeophtheirus salmonis]